jgi:hypothetical protein
MGDWNFNINEAPKGGIVETTIQTTKGERVTKQYVAPLIIAAGREGIVTASRWLPEAERWNMFSKDFPPIAWQPWPEAPDVPKD